MSEFKKGDRVRVTHEGEISWIGDGGRSLEVTTDDRHKGYVYAAPENLTLLERPVDPLAPGSVVSRRDDTFVVVDAGTVVRVRPNGHVTPDSAYSPKALAKYVAEGAEFFLTHDGSKK